ncbi:DnaJ family molecular chaperone [Tropicimonas aquimaris]|uniref:DnaJ family molecular chaperone n=2 Tax=Tropicimonas aquimaris TaxID=914152 RepID=A0ABW3ISP2_9RHOB
MRQVYRRLVRRFHPDLGGPADFLAQINAAYDAIRRDRPFALPAVAARPLRRRPVATCRLGRDLQKSMAETALLALDDWLAVRHGLPRSPLLRQMACRSGLFSPVERPGLLLPCGVTLWSEALVLHHDGAIRAGPNILILPGLRAGDGGRPEPNGNLSAILRSVPRPSRVIELPVEDARRYGLDLRFDDRALPVRLRFAGRGENAGAALCDATAKRYRGLFRQAIAPEF